jgi:hypothetical protein
MAQPGPNVTVPESNLESELMRKAVGLNKWTQRLMYTLQTDALGLEPSILNKQVELLDSAIGKVMNACELQDKNRYQPGNPA